MIAVKSGRPIQINRDHVVAVEPAYDQKGVAVLGQCALLTDLPPPNMPGAGHVSIEVKGSFEEVSRAFFPEDFTEEVSGE